MMKISKVVALLADLVVGPPAATKIIGVGGLGLEVVKNLIVDKKTKGEIGDFLSDRACCNGALGMEVMRSVTWNNEANDDIEYIAIDTLKMPYLAADISRHINRRSQPLEDRDIGEVTDSERSLIIPVIKDTGQIVIIAGLGGVTGTTVVPALAMIAKELKVTATLIITKPFRFGGKETGKIAERGLGAIFRQDYRNVVIDLEDIGRKCPKDTTLREVYDRGKEAVFRTVKELLP